MPSCPTSLEKGFNDIFNNTIGTYHISAGGKKICSYVRVRFILVISGVVSAYHFNENSDLAFAIK